MPHGDGFADEADDYERLIAAERIHEWLEHARAAATCRAEEADGPPPQRWKALQRKAGRSLSAFAEHVATSAAYAEEAHLLGAPDALTKLLASEELSEELTDAVSAALAAISGPGAAPPRTRSVPVAGTSVVVEEGALADGLGARLWRAALLLCESREFAPLIAGREVLELGAGVGLSGIAAARLGASRVVLTDCEATVLEILDRNAAANREVCAPCPLEVAYLQWADDALDACAPERRSGWEAEPPSHASLERGRKFDAVIAADFVYDDAHADLIPAVLAARVRPGGGALLLAAVRQEDLLDSLLDRLKAHGLQAVATRFQLESDVPAEAATRVNGAKAMYTPNEVEYAGGFVQIAAWHAGDNAHPFPDMEGKL